MQYRLENCRIIEKSTYSGIFFCQQMLPAHRVAGLQFSPRDGSAIISDNCIAIAGEKLLM